MAVQHRLTRRLAGLRAWIRCEKRKLKSITTAPGITLPAPVPPWMLLICQVVAGKKSLPRSHSVPTSSASAGAKPVDRVLGQVRIGDVALHALDGQLAAQRAAPAVLDHVADALDRGRLTDDAVVEPFAALLQRVADDGRAVDDRAFLVAGEQQRDRQPAWSGAARRNSSTATTKAAIEVFMSPAPRPYSLPSRWVGMNGSLVHCSSGPVGTTSVWPANTTVSAPAAGRAPGPQVGDPKVARPAFDGFADEAQRRQPLAEQCLAAASSGVTEGREISCSASCRPGHQASDRNWPRALARDRLHVERDLGERRRLGLIGLRGGFVVALRSCR